MASASNSNVIQVEGGLISGVENENNDVLIFKGVPYAAPPVGNLRWCPPQPVIPWEGVRKCDKFDIERKIVFHIIKKTMYLCL